MTLLAGAIAAARRLIILDSFRLITLGLPILRAGSLRCRRMRKAEQTVLSDFEVTSSLSTANALRNQRIRGDHPRPEPHHYLHPRHHHCRHRALRRPRVALARALALLLEEINATPPCLPGDTRPITYRLTTASPV
jgi:hypothetical protein